VPRASHDGGIPSWLRAVTPRLTAVRRASLRAPVLATQGDTVAVDVGRAELRATAVGPKVPAASGLSATAGDAVSGTFVVTLAGGARPVTLAPAAFTVVDEFGMLHHPEVSAAGGGAVPGQLRPGQRLTLVVRDVLPVGNGRLQWSPAGGRPVVAWDFDLELS
jgi:hypothetical protein